jgi:diaminopimelate decarboxylase
MNHFTYQGDELFCEDVPVSDIAREVGAPFYIYSRATLKRHFQVFDSSFEGMDRLVCYSAKANSSLAILSLFNRMGSGLDIVSGGELYRGLKAGFPPEKIVYSGVGKRGDEIDFALQTGIAMFNVESIEELEAINQRAGHLGKQAPISIRVNPDVDPKTHPYISTGMKTNKFGIGADAALEGYRMARDMAHIRPMGIDCHIGSQLTDAEPFREALTNLLKLAKKIKKMGIHITHIDMGGGLGISYDKESPPTPAEYASKIKDALGGLKATLVLEPGRVIVGNAGALVTQVLYRKKSPEKNFVIIDAGMNDLIRPSLYGAFHDIRPVKKTEGEMITADVVGPICESGDFLATDRKMRRPERGDLLAVMSAGAYGFVMASNYCSRLRPAEVMADGDRFFVIRKRQTYGDLVDGESVPDF